MLIYFHSNIIIKTNQVPATVAMAPSSSTTLAVGGGVGGEDMTS